MTTSTKNKIRSILEDNVCSLIDDMLEGAVERALASIDLEEIVTDALADAVQSQIEDEVEEIVSDIIEGAI